MQTAKTTIRRAGDELRREFEGAVPAIRDLNREFIDEAVDANVLPADRSSVPVSVIDDLIEPDPASMDPEVIRRAWRKFVLDVDEPNRSMFRYLLRRFAATRDHIAVPYCSLRLRSNPEALTEILRYFGDLDDHTLETPITKALTSRELDPYPYSRYLLLGWLARNRPTLRAASLRAVRAHAIGAHQPDYVRARARAVLGKLGDHSDLDHLAALLPGTPGPFERAQLLCTLTRLERGRRSRGSAQE